MGSTRSVPHGKRIRRELIASLGREPTNSEVRDESNRRFGKTDADRDRDANRHSASRAWRWQNRSTRRKRNA